MSGVLKQGLNHETAILQVPSDPTNSLPAPVVMSILQVFLSKGQASSSRISTTGRG